MTLTALPPSQELANIVGALKGRWHGHIAMARCPVHPDRTPSLSLRQGEKAILVTCFAGCRRVDVVRAIRQLGSGQDFPIPRGGARSTPTSVIRLWDTAIEPNGTLGEQYLSARGLVGLTHDVRFHPRCPLGPRPYTSFHPALLVAVREAHRLVALQRIFLEPPTGGRRMKLMLGSPGRGSWQGRAGGDQLAIAEGFETAAAFTRLHDVAAWASLGAGRLGRLLIPSTVKCLLLAGDRDAEGVRAVGQARKDYVQPGLMIRVTMPPPGYKDWAEVLQARIIRPG